MKKATIFTPEVQQNIMKLIEAGYGTSKIAKEIGIRASSLSRYMYKNNLVCVQKQEKNVDASAYPAELIKAWDALHNWYLAYRRLHPKERSEGGIRDGY